MAEKIIDPFVNLEGVEIPYSPDNGRSEAMRSMSVGVGQRALYADERGMWLGAELPQDSNFYVDMDGNAYITGYFDFTTDDLDDIPDGSTFKRTTANEKTGADRAFNGLNTSYEIVKGFLNSQLSSLSLPSNGVRIDSNGIYGRKSGVTKFYLDTSGNAYFEGTIVASTITGSTLQTGTSGENVNITSAYISLRQDTTEVGYLRAFDAGLGYVGKLGVQYILARNFASPNGTIMFNLDNTIGHILFKKHMYADDSNLDIGATGFMWRDIYLTGGITTNNNTLVINPGTSHVRVRSSGSSSSYVQLFHDGTDAHVNAITGDLLLDATGGEVKSAVDIWAPGVFPQVNGDGGVGKSGREWDQMWANDTSINTSDRRKKKDIEAETLGLDFIRGLKPVTYRWKNNKGVPHPRADKYTEIHHGFIAQDIEEQIGLALGIVKYENDIDQYYLKYAELQGPTVRAIQEMADRLETAENEIALLKKKVV